MQHLRHPMDGVFERLNEFAECGFQRLLIDVPPLTQPPKTGLHGLYGGQPVETVHNQTALSPVLVALAHRRQKVVQQAHLLRQGEQGDEMPWVRPRSGAPAPHHAGVNVQAAG